MIYDIYMHISGADPGFDVKGARYFNIFILFPESSKYDLRVSVGGVRGV